MATIHLTGGGPGAVLALRRHFKAALAELGADKPVVAYVGAASDDHTGFFRMIQGAVATTGARMKMAKLASPRAKASEARALLEDADLVFVSGPDLHRRVQVLHERDAARTLVALAKAGKPMFGISAGSLMLAREWVRFPEGDEANPEIFPCLGIAPVHVDAHSEEDDWSELRVLVDLLRRRGDPDPVGYGLTRKGGLRLALDNGGVNLRALGTPIPRVVVKRGKPVIGAPLEDA